MDLIQAIASIPGIGPYLPWIGVVVAAAATIAPFLPPPAPVSGWPYSAIYRAVQWCALNVGHAKNATDPKVK